MPREVVLDLCEAAGLDVNLDSYAGVGEPLECVHRACGRRVTPTVNTLRALGRGCRYCAFRSTEGEPGLVYLLLLEPERVFKIGVTVAQPVAESRTAMLARRYGWKVIATWRTPTKVVARAVEAAVLRWARHDLGLPPFLGPEQTEGWTETFDGETLSVPGVRALVERVVGDTVGSLQDAVLPCERFMG